MCTKSCLQYLPCSSFSPLPYSPCPSSVQNAEIQKLIKSKKLSYKQPAALPYFFFFMIRRLIFTITAFYCSDIFCIQVQVYIYCSLFNYTYLGYVKPLEGKINNILEIYNEITILGVGYHLLLFTDFVPDSDLQYSAGFSVIVWVLLNILVNFIVMMVMSFLILKEFLCSLAHICRKKAKLHQADGRDNAYSEDLFQRFEQSKPISTDFPLKGSTNDIRQELKDIINQPDEVSEIIVKKKKEEFGDNMSHMDFQGYEIQNQIKPYENRTDARNAILMNQDFSLSQIKHDDSQFQSSVDSDAYFELQNQRQRSYPLQIAEEAKRLDFLGNHSEPQKREFIVKQQSFMHEERKGQIPILKAYQMQQIEKSLAQKVKEGQTKSLKII